MSNDEIHVVAQGGGPVQTVPRVPDLAQMLQSKSHFMLGPRQTGKTFLIRVALPDAKTYDLLDSTVYLALSQRPSRLAEDLTHQNEIVAIDEIQRLPEMLNEVHRLIEERGVNSL